MNVIGGIALFLGVMFFVVGIYILSFSFAAMAVDDDKVLFWIKE